MVSRTRTPKHFDYAEGISLLALGGRYGQSETQLIEKAFQLAIESDQEEELTTTSTQKALSIARLLSDIEAHPHCIVAALLRSLPWSRLEKMALREEFGGEVVTIIHDLHRIDQTINAIEAVPQAKQHDQQRLEGIRKLLLAMAQDIRVVIVALAEQVWLMRFASELDRSDQLRLAHQTMDLYAPLANRLGVWHLKWELEDLSFRILEPDTYKLIAQRLDEKLVDREHYINNVIKALDKELQTAGIEAMLHGRPKHIYSIVKKMRSKNLDFEHLYDVRAVRVVVKEIRDCYSVLGVVHHLWIPIAGEFDDYIARPKGNFYRSLHTAVIGPEDKALEIQIRTQEMHRDSELGVASHWRYKEGATKTDKHFDERVAWLRQMLAWQYEVTMTNSARTAVPVLDDVIYVFTPQGRVIDLPRGATPIDFAYHVHTDLGHHCRGAKVDGQIVNLNHPLDNAQRVEIITVRQGGPSRDWLNPEYGYLKSSRALAKVRQWFKQQHQEEDIAQGKIIFEKLTQRIGKTPVNIERLAQQVGYSRVEDFLIGLARGDISQHQIELQLIPETQHDSVTPEQMIHPALDQGSGGVLVLGVTNIATFFAKCCKPVPPEPIVGFVTRGRGVSIHRANCRSLAALTGTQWQRMMPAQWGQSTEGLYSVDVVVEAQDRQGLLRDISESFTREHINVTAVNTLSRGVQAHMKFTVQIYALEQLGRALKIVSAVKGVTQVYRQ
ncbi:MAG: GTP pyrophosphokinase [Ferrovum sp. 37-45-19]|uniref:RelA/SpoT family protein n=1 Tax=Ferrovum sp. JA12 TaxID=1356299 RepID=UPI000702D66D|nr:bifunctional (p)ppGpp synthetase/guanosine-3',5'-bis(diphosphate) 3'-pyrophosphohydrolase [Ferrovum sp. JA12]OYV79834.1 MAG: GTP pyrophosphokinase [Ferrovum sp. 21-44-67]OYV95458.1 MAG: GTP pyrophosphokinase [Ferrovum sp. 37-45-19]OZB31506.1 MAG: GTP pyrophosphokinase [Ferrovum sp. 34-44-207]HQT81253.1 bifunctional (p)ppGpp synthetase/guanosine-3',5'-bis(diphosphate) 3'-pyrophosphohydrolase [Ferrovaceae bacterium]KRH78140.1 GTP pyrophosphokinase [Ferrovum sp. JA12]